MFGRKDGELGWASLGWIGEMSYHPYIDHIAGDVGSLPVFKLEAEVLSQQCSSRLSF